MKSVFDLAREDTHLKKVAGNEYAGPCPICHGDDRFRVNLSKRKGAGGWMCRGCHPADVAGWGDDYDYMVEMRGMSKAEAYKITRSQVEDLIERVDTIRQAQPVNNQPPGQDWQRKAALYVDRAVSRLWSQEGRFALAYLRRRGLDDPIIKAAQLGYALDQEHDTTVPRLVIPWHVDKSGMLWAVQRRDLRPKCPKDERYKMFPGSSKQGLYGGGLLQSEKKCMTFLCEGELDALTIAQEGKGLDIIALATGGEGGAKSGLWPIKLARMPLVLLAQDNEEKGDKQAREWLSVLGDVAQRYKPLTKDVNEMLVTGWDVRAWLEAATNLLYSDVWESEPDQPVTPAPISIQQPCDQPAIGVALLLCESEPPTQASEYTANCDVCGAVLVDQAGASIPFDTDDQDDSSWQIDDVTGELFCPSCWQAQAQTEENREKQSSQPAQDEDQTQNLTSEPAPANPGQGSHAIQQIDGIFPRCAVQAVKLASMTSDEYIAQDQEQRRQEKSARILASVEQEQVAVQQIAITEKISPAQAKSWYNLRANLAKHRAEDQRRCLYPEQVQEHETWRQAQLEAYRSQVLPERTSI